MTNDRPVYILPLVNNNAYLPIIGHLNCMTSFFIRHYKLLKFFYTKNVYLFCLKKGGQMLQSLAELSRLTSDTISCFFNLLLLSYLWTKLILLQQHSAKFCIELWQKSRGFKGIRQWPINWCLSAMRIHNITFSVDFN